MANGTVIARHSSPAIRAIRRNGLPQTTELAHHFCHRVSVHYVVFALVMAQPTCHHFPTTRRDQLTVPRIVLAPHGRAPGLRPFLYCAVGGLLRWQHPGRVPFPLR